MNVELTPTPPSDRPRWMIFAAAAAVIALVVVGIAFARRKDTNTDKPASSHDVTFTVTWSDSAGDFVRECAYGGVACLTHFPMPADSEFKGDIAGHAYQGLFWTNRDDSGQKVTHEEFGATYGVSGNVLGCASGGFGDFMLTEMAQTKANTETFSTRGTYTGTWQIVPESGRSLLASISGSGTSTGDITYADKSTWARTFTGTISCP